MLKMKILGKPYAGKLHVRFDEGVEEDKVRKCGSTLYRLPSSSLLYRFKNENVYPARPEGLIKSRNRLGRS
jgi:hypothetical protein